MSSLVRVENLWAGYSGNAVVRDVSFCVNKGEVVGVIGPNGAGKTTLVKALSRAIRPLKGSVIYDGKDVHAISPNESARLIAVVPQDTFIVFEFLVWDVVMMGRIPHMRRFKKETERDLQVAERALRLTGTKELSGRFVNELSAGERQRVIIAKALAQEPGLLILDEPTSHLDISHQVEIFDMVRDLSRKDGLAVITVLHDLNLASEYCDKLILMYGGAIFKQGTPGQVLDYKTIEDVYKTVVVVKENPISRKPYVFAVPQKNREK